MDWAHLKKIKKEWWKEQQSGDQWQYGCQTEWSMKDWFTDVKMEKMLLRHEKKLKIPNCSNLAMDR